MHQSENIQVTPILPIMFQVNWLFGSGEKIQMTFSKLRSWRPSLIPSLHYRNDVSHFCLPVAPILTIKFRVNQPFGSGDKFKVDFQDGCCGSHLQILIETILVIFRLQVTMILPTNFQIIWPFHSEEEV